ncbi:hypothetical protein D3C79_960480 [compost metagenome]
MVVLAGATRFFCEARFVSGNAGRSDVRRVAPFGGKFPESEYSIKESENPTRKTGCHISKFRTRLRGAGTGSVLAGP